MNELENGTYVKLGNESIRIETTNGYWVATEQVPYRDQLENGELFGVWVSEDGYRWIDRVVWVASKDYAVLLGRENNQLAIYDNAKQDSLFLLSDNREQYLKESE